MTPESVFGAIEKGMELLQKLSGLGLKLSLLVMLAVWATMQFVVKRIDRAAWLALRGKQKRGNRPKDNAFLVAWYPVIAMVLGAVWNLIARLVGLVPDSPGLAAFNGVISAMAMSAAFKAFTVWRNYRRLSAGVRAGTIKVEPGSDG